MRSERTEAMNASESSFLYNVDNSADLDKHSAAPCSSLHKSYGQPCKIMNKYGRSRRYSPGHHRMRERKVCEGSYLPRGKSIKL